MPWLQEFKLALIKQDSKKLLFFIQSLPRFDTLTEMQEASLLISQAITFFKNVKKQAGQEMSKISNARKYLEN